MARMRLLAWRILAAGLVVLVASLPSVSHADPAPSPSQLQTLQLRQYHADKAAVFGSVVDVLQDLGFTIDNADLQSGFVTAESATVGKTNFLDFLTEAQGSGNTKATAFIETMSGSLTRIRLTFVAVKTTSGPYGQGAREDTPIFDPRLYQRLFGRIDAAVLARTGDIGAAGTLQGDITPIAALGPAETRTSPLSTVELLAAAKQVLVAEGFQILKFDEASGSIVTAPTGVHLTVDQADCGKMLGIAYLRDQRASTDVQYFVDVAGGSITARTAIDGLYRTGYGNPDKSLTCTSRGVLESSFLAKVVQQSDQPPPSGVPK
jgi:hypothetical protein